MKKWISRNKRLLLIAAAISAVLTAAYLSGNKTSTDTAVQKSSAVSVVSEGKNNDQESSVEESKNEEYSPDKNNSEISIETGNNASSVAENKEKESSTANQNSSAADDAVSSVSENKRSESSSADRNSFSDNTSSVSEEVSKAESIKENSVPESSIELSSIPQSSIQESSTVIRTDNEPEITDVPSEKSSEPEKRSEAFIDDGSSQVQSNSSPESNASSASSSEASPESSTAGRTISSEPEPDTKTTRCSITIDCHTAIADSRLNKRTKSLLPENGMIISAQSISFEKGETVFDVLKRCCEDNDIQLEYNLTPISGGAYIEGIANLYEFDCGNISGWMYSVNGEFPAVGCSDYKVGENDCISFIYSCDLGADIGNDYRG